MVLTYNGAPGYHGDAIPCLTTRTLLEGQSTIPIKVVEYISYSVDEVLGCNSTDSGYYGQVTNVQNVIASAHYVK